jgi:hypothetical protein
MALPTGKGASGPLAALEDAHARRRTRLAAPSGRVFEIRFVLMCKV